ncbi:hypothetical protein ACG3RN_01015, partial [Pseudomonas aeruginosa]
KSVERNEQRRKFLGAGTKTNELRPGVKRRINLQRNAGTREGPEVTLQMKNSKMYQRDEF